MGETLIVDGYNIINIRRDYFNLVPGTMGDAERNYWTSSWIIRDIPDTE